MKKSILGLAALALLASCNNDEELNSLPPEAITFGNPFVDNATRAIDPTYNAENLKQFYVYGTVQGTGNGIVNIFDGDVVTGNVGEKENNEFKAWNCDVKQYWIADAQYNFAAVVDVDKDNNNLPDGVEVDGNGMPVSINYVTANQNDLLYATATATGKATGNGLVDFSFKHLLSKAYFTVTSNTEGGYYYTVENIQVSNYKGGTYKVADEQWIPGEGGNVDFGDVTYVTKSEAKTNATQMLLVPTTNNFKVSFTVKIWNGDGTGDDEVLLGVTEYKDGDSDVTHNAITVENDLVAGYAYNFNINLTVGELIQFTVTSNPTWTGGGGVDVE